MWYEVTAFISELDADLLSKGQFVLITGRLEVEAFLRRNGEPGASAKLLANRIDPVERKTPAAAA
jgi:single-stranded DNA-binding protein